MKLEKLNLEKALNGRPVIARNGNTVKIAGYNKDAKPEHRLIGWDADGDCVSWYEDGIFDFKRKESSLDLFHPAEEKQPRTFWVNEFENGMGGIYSSEEEAKSSKSLTGYITTHKITIP